MEPFDQEEEKAKVINDATVDYYKTLSNVIQNNFKNLQTQMEELNKTMKEIKDELKKHNSINDTFQKHTKILQGFYKDLDDQQIMSIDLNNA